MSLQYVLDSICARITTRFMYNLIEERLKQGPTTVGELLPLIKCEDAALDFAATKQIADAALEEMAQKDMLRVEGDNIYSIK